MTIGLAAVAPRASVSTATRQGSVVGFEREERGRQRVGLVQEVGRLRQCLALDAVLDDQTILASLEDIACFSDPHARWQAAFESTLGLWLALTCSDVEAALAVVVAAVPSHS